jgi:hypothetical protein
MAPSASWALEVVPDVIGPARGVFEFTGVGAVLWTDADA